MMGPFAFCVKLLITLDTLVLVPSWKVDCLHMNQRIGPSVADLATQHTLELSNVLSLSEFAGVPVETLFNLFSIFPSVIIILHLQCSQVLHKLRSKRVPCSISVQEQRLKLIAVCILNGLVNQVSHEGFSEKKWG